MAEPWRAPFASSESVRQRMSSLPRKDTQPEVALRRSLHARGLRYVVHRRPDPTLRRTADVVFTRAKVAVFVDGCFWHGCPDHGRRMHRTNDWYWPDKIQRNQAHDCDTNERLTTAGWHVVRVWEHDDPDQTAEQIAQLVIGRTSGVGSPR